ncbi:cytochrome P450 [Agrocybe pediades]|nr:cytochrome P450 [Agrocybe pediades]
MVVSQQTLVVNPLVWVACAILPVIIYFGVKRKSSSLPYPPGPPRYPIIGNLLHLPLSYQWIAFDKWCRQQETELLYFSGAGFNVLVVNSLEAVTELFERKWSIYSHRPKFPMVCDLMGWDWLFGLMEYGEPWRERRKLFTQYFHPSEPTSFKPHAMQFSRGMLPKLLESPEDFLNIARHAVGGSALSMAYGFPIMEHDDPHIQLAEKALETMNIGTLPSNFLVNIIPSLKYVPGWVPGAGFQKIAKDWRQIQKDFREKPFARSLEAMADGTASPCYVTNRMDSLQGLRGSEREYSLALVRDNAAQVFQAAAETTLAALQFFFAAMLCYPEVQKKAQLELDHVLGGRLPEYADEEHTPYVRALIKEILRWKPILPLGVPHTTSQDDVYKGYHIPKGTFVMANSWAFLHDPKHFPNPDVFDPERFLSNGRVRTDIRDPVDIAFGYGRRICPGNHIALSFLWVAISTILTVYDITKEVNQNGQEVTPNIEFKPNILFEVAPFKCTIKPRSKECEELIRNVGYETEA